MGTPQHDTVTQIISSSIGFTCLRLGGRRQLIQCALRHGVQLVRLHVSRKLRNEIISSSFQLRFHSLRKIGTALSLAPESDPIFCEYQAVLTLFLHFPASRSDYDSRDGHLSHCAWKSLVWRGIHATRVFSHCSSPSPTAIRSQEKFA